MRTSLRWGRPRCRLAAHPQLKLKRRSTALVEGGKSSNGGGRCAGPGGVTRQLGAPRARCVLLTGRHGGVRAVQAAEGAPAPQFSIEDAADVTLQQSTTTHLTAHWVHMHAEELASVDHGITTSWQVRSLPHPSPGTRRRSHAPPPASLTVCVHALLAVDVQCAIERFPGLN